MLFGKQEGPCRRILFLGGHSFELIEEAKDQIGHRRVAIMERGQGLHRAVCGYEVGRFCVMLHKVSREPGCFAYLARVIGGCHSVAA